MSISTADVKWGKYKQYEGPYYHGRHKFTLTANPTKEEKIIYVITQTEGGTFDAVNLYDSCISSLGLIQFCDRFHLVSRLLGAVADGLGLDAVTKPLSTPMKLVGATFQRNRNKQWRFFINGNECSTEKDLQRLYLGGSSGLIGQWTPEQAEIAKAWVVGLAGIWDNSSAREIQTRYTASRLLSFVMPETKRILFADDDWASWKGLIKAAFLSYAANNPKLASENFLIAHKTAKNAMWSPRWCIHVLKQLTFGPKIAIYPGRYDKIRPALEKIYEVNILPKTSDDLLTWQGDVIDVEPKDEGNSDLRQVAPNETPTLPSPEPPPTPISEPPERELVFPEEVIKPLPAPPHLPREARPTMPVTAPAWMSLVVNIIKTLFTLLKR